MSIDYRIHDILKLMNENLFHINKSLHIISAYIVKRELEDKGLKDFGVPSAPSEEAIQEHINTYIKGD